MFHVVAHDLGPTSPAQPRIAALVRELARRGHDIELWTAREAAIDARAHVLADPLRLLRAPTGPSSNGRPSLVRRLGRALLFPDGEAPWSLRVCAALAPRLHPSDVVITCARPESAGFAGELAHARHARWWSDYADGWSYQGLRGSRGTLELALERRWLRKADGVSTVTAELAADFAEKRGAPVTLFPNLVPEDLSRATHRPGAFVLGHFGRLAHSDPDRSLAPVIAAANADTRFIFHGDYGPRDLTELEALRRTGAQVEVCAPLERELLSGVAVDALLVVGSPRNLGTTSKLLDALALELPVIACVPDTSAAARLVRDTGVGEVAPLEDAAAARAAWVRFEAGVRTGAYRVDPTERSRYTGAQIVPPVADALEALAAQPGRAVP